MKKLVCFKTLCLLIILALLLPFGLSHFVWAYDYPTFQSDFWLDGDCLIGLQPGMTAEQIKGCITVENGTIELTGTGTGAELIIRDLNGQVCYSYTILIYGDVDGDGVISAKDISALKLHLVDIAYLEGVYKKAGNILTMNENDPLSAGNISRLKMHLVNIKEITPPGSPEPATLVIATISPSGPVKGAPDFAAKTKRLNEIKAKHNVNIQFIDFGGAWETYYQFYAAKVMAAEALGDVCGVGTEMTYPGYVLRKYVQELDPTVWKLNNANMWDTVKNDELRYDGKYYVAAPISYPDVNNLVNTPVLFFNKYLLTQAGYNKNQLYTWQSNKEWTWAKFTEVVKQINGLTIADRKDVRGMGADGGVGGQLYAGFLTSANTGGGHLLPAEKKAVYTLDSSEARTALNFVYNLLFIDKVGRTDIAPGDWTTNSNKFQNGTLGFYGAELQFGHYIKDQRQQALPIGDKYGVVLYPIPKDQGLGINDYQIHVRKHAVLVVPPSIKTNTIAFKTKAAAATDWFAPNYGAPTIDHGSYDDLLCDTQSRETLKLINQNARNVYSTDVFNGLFPGDLRTGPPHYMSIDQFLESIRVEANNRVKNAYNY